MPPAMLETPGLLAPVRTPFAALRAARTGLEPDAIVSAVLASGLRGRGGAGFLTGTKLASARAAAGPRRYVLVNAAEDEPGSGKDRELLERVPERVIEGALIAAYAVGAQHVVVYAAEGAAAGATRGLRAAEAVGVQTLPQTLRPTDSAPAPVTASLVRAPRAYVGGEDTAALEVAEGRAPLPRGRPPFPTEEGLWGCPTVVANVETLAALPAIVSGEAPAAATMLVTLGPEIARPGVHEVPVGTSLRTVIESVGGGLRNGGAVRAVLPGGPSSGFLAARDLELPLDREALERAGSALGCGAIRVYDQTACIACALRDVLAFFAAESCGQCPPCRMETQMLLRLLDQVRAGAGGAALLAKLPEVLDFAAGQKANCSLVRMPDRPVRSALEHFGDDFDHHMAEGRCAPGRHDPTEAGHVSTTPPQAQVRD